MQNSKTIEALTEILNANQDAVDKVSQFLTEQAERTNTAILTIIGEIGKPDKPNAKEYMTYNEASVYLSIPKGTLAHKVSKKQIPYCKAGGSVRFRKAELDEWIKTNSRETDQELNTKYDKQIGHR